MKNRPVLRCTLWMNLLFNDKSFWLYVTKAGIGKQHVPLSALKMLCLYSLGQKCLHLTFYRYLSSETYSHKYEKLPNVPRRYPCM